MLSLRSAEWLRSFEPERERDRLRECLSFLSSERERSLWKKKKFVIFWRFSFFYVLPWSWSTLIIRCIASASVSVISSWSLTSTAIWITATRARFLWTAAASWLACLLFSWRFRATSTWLWTASTRLWATGWASWARSISKGINYINLWVLINLTLNDGECYASGCDFLTMSVSAHDESVVYPQLNEYDVHSIRCRPISR